MKTNECSPTVFLKVSVIFCLLFSGYLLNAQLKVRSDGSIHTGYTGYSNLWLGNYASEGANNGQYCIENWGTSLNIWKPWPSPYNNIDRNYYLFINVAGGVGIGKAPTNPGIVLEVAGHVYASCYHLSSDERLKKEITPLTEKTALIYSLNGKSYKKNIQPARIEMPEQKDNSGMPFAEKYNNNISTDPREFKEFGFIAQELKEVYPELVSQDTLGYYCINYTGLIPLLVEALKEQKKLIENLEYKINNVTSPVNQKVHNDARTDISAYPELRQNTPNPYSDETSISFYLPASVTAANIYIYDMGGQQLKDISLSERGESSIVIQGKVLNAGMYMYALIADGKVIDTKRMILTK